MATVDIGGDAAGQAILGVHQSRNAGGDDLFEAELAAFAKQQAEVDRLRDEQRDCDQQRHLASKAARPKRQPAHSRVTSAASV